jgi:hypothetical protein
MSKSNAYTKETKIKGFVDPAEIELATKIAKALIEEESNAYVVHLTKKLDELKKANRKANA